MAAIRRRGRIVFGFHICPDKWIAVSSENIDWRFSAVVLIITGGLSGFGNSSGPISFKCSFWSFGQDSPMNLICSEFRFELARNNSSIRFFPFVFNSLLKESQYENCWSSIVFKGSEDVAKVSIIIEVGSSTLLSPWELKLIGTDRDKCCIFGHNVSNRLIFTNWGSNSQKCVNLRRSCSILNDWCSKIFPIDPKLIYSSFGSPFIRFLTPCNVIPCWN